MDTWVIVLIVVAVLVVVALALAWSRKNRTEALQGRFGPEYERAVEATGDQRTAEKELKAREERREKLQIRSLDPQTRDLYQQRWTDTQARFVDEPNEAVGMADSLVMSVMRDRGYPVDDFEQRAADISVDHPQVVDNYRAAHRISTARETGESSTEDLRQAMVHFRSLFEELLEPASTDTTDDDQSDLRNEAQVAADRDLRVEGAPTVDQIDLRDDEITRRPVDRRDLT
jgi:hypothetical protein